MDIYTGSQASRAEKTTRIQDEFSNTSTQMSSNTTAKRNTAPAPRSRKAILLILSRVTKPGEERCHMSDTSNSEREAHPRLHQHRSTLHQNWSIDENKDLDGTVMEFRKSYSYGAEMRITCLIQATFEAYLTYLSEPFKSQAPSELQNQPEPTACSSASCS